MIKRAAFLVFPHVTLLDIVGPYDALRRVKTMGFDARFEWRFIGTHDRVLDDSAFPIQLDAVLPNLDDYDLLVVPGGKGTDYLAGDQRFFNWLRTWGETRPIASVCSGSLLRGEAGWLAGLPATTHPSRYELLRPYCSDVVINQRVVDAGRVITAGGVTCGIDLGIHLVNRFWGTDASTRIARRMQVPGFEGAGAGAGAGPNSIR